jgi:hypothetical protein
MTSENKFTELTKIFGKKIKYEKIFHPNIQENSEKTFVIDKITRIRDFAELISIEISIETTIAVALNKPDKICLINKPYKLQGFPYPLYYDSEFSDNPDGFLRDTMVEFKNLNLSDKESIVIYKNQFCVFAEKFRDIPNLINKLQTIIIQLPKSKKANLDLKGLPKNLKVLVPFTENWSISDDEIRNELIHSLTLSDKKQIILLVAPLINCINDYLHSFKQKPLSEIAQKISNLAELYDEIKTS